MGRCFMPVALRGKKKLSRMYEKSGRVALICFGHMVRPAYSPMGGTGYSAMIFFTAAGMFSSLDEGS